MAINGTDVLLLINVAASGEEDLFTPVGSQLGLQTQNTREMISAAHKNSPYTRSIYGRQSSTLTLDALFVPDEESYELLRLAQAEGNRLLVRREEQGHAVEEAWALVVSLSEGYPDNDVSTVAIELQIESLWQQV